MPPEIITEIAPVRPTITLWNRLEGRPRTQDFSRALKAEVRDALWMLSKQWQTGEFQGEDAASAILAKVHIKTTSLTKYQAGSANPQRYQDQAQPLEVQVEQQPIIFERGQQPMSLDLRAMMGRHWLKLISKSGLADATTIKTVFKTDFGFAAPVVDAESDARKTAHLETWRQYAGLAKGCVDGYRVYEGLKGGTASTLISLVVSDPLKLDQLGERFKAWFEKLYVQPTADKNPSWQPDHLEHQFSCAAPSGTDEKVFFADEYYHGHLDWYNLDIHDQRAELGAVAGAPTDEVQDTFTLSFLPGPATFPGMPHSRWWQLEDWKTDLGKISPDTTDINQLMLLDFTLNYSNDWLLFPFTLPVGSIAEVEGLMVTNTFGEKIWISAAGRGSDEDWNRWSMFHLNTRGSYDVPQDLSLLLMPAAAKVSEGKPLEEVYLMRDEVANMVWGLEARVPLATGKSKRGKEADLELRNKLAQFITTAPRVLPVANEAKVQYQIMNEVPGHWIPFIPVRKPGSQREIQLQRAAMPRIFEGDTQVPKKIEPQTSLLREGLDEANPTTYHLFEEAVPRAGAHLKKCFQRTRWYDGRVLTWVGMRKQVGRGEGHSGLRFDQVIPKSK